MRALIIGASGQAGHALTQTFRARGDQAFGTYSEHSFGQLSPLDVTDRVAVERMIEDVAPDWVLCPAGLSHVDYCEDHPDEAFAINRDAALHAARVGARRGAGFVFFSSEYVFDGESGPCVEEGPARPLSVCGRSKWEGERAVLAEITRAVVVRTTVVYGPDRQQKNFVCQLIRACRNGQPMR